MSTPALAGDVFIVFDLETTGLDAEKGDEIVEFGAVPIIEGRLRPDCAFQALVDPDRPIPAEAAAIHGISDDMVKGRPRLDVVLPEFLRYVGGHALVAQNASFDLGFLRAACDRVGLALPPGAVHDTMLLSRRSYPSERRHGLDDICRRLRISTEGKQRHRSIDDVLLTGEAFLKLIERLAERGEAL
jgi:DNA polymerase-3 subunit epsilon